MPNSPGSEVRVKAKRQPIMQQLVGGIEVKSRDEIVPTFRIPATPVRVMDRVVGGPGLEPG